MSACPSCGREVVAGAKFCSECGASTTAAPAFPEAAPPQTAPIPPPTSASTPALPPAAPPPSVPLWYPPPGAPFPGRYTYQRPRTALPTAAGVLLIISGVLAMIVWGLLLATGASEIEAILPGASSVLAVCGAIEFVFAVVMIAGGAMALNRRMWGLGLAGSILGLFTIGFIFETSIMSLIALILLAVSRNEFR